MWELIRANKRKSLFLFVCLGACLLVLGYFIGSAFSPGRGGVVGLFIAAGVWFSGSVISYFSGESIILALSNARQVSRDVHPQLFNVVEEMKIAANLHSMPKIYIIPDRAANAFATGRKPEKAAIVVTAGLLSKLNRDQLQGVIAHEMSHIMNRDVLFMTFAGVLLGSIVLISGLFLRSMWFTGGSSRRYSAGKSVKGSGQAQLILIAVAIVLAILAPLIARLLYFAISRKREYLADACAARLTRYPEGLASALEQISANPFGLASANKITAPMYIVNPLKSVGSTHPPTSERIKILRSMSQGANYTDYQNAYSLVKGKSSAIIPPSGLYKKEAVPIRKASVEKQLERGKKKTARDVGDLMRAVNGYAFLMCACGLKIKVPPNFKDDKIPCSRCGRQFEVPTAQLAAIASAAGISMAEEDRKTEEQSITQTAVYIRKSAGWESFSCVCGNLLQISPVFSGSHITCRSCGRKTVIKS
ncbi:MAG TPA: peptidase M28 [Phycisphaerales bacterium]|nr:peptidase M28 [Phycisphaerales bacterium]